ncbi:MAG: malto-oligosyltrehalose synthase, partial [Candidatus Eremiobacteraeota bacterium]|nr:malto-oligosyltrehalose synthase [Candidatus Eremiobacteraeota bacterium]
LERINRRHKRDVDGSSAPDRVDEWFLYQTLIGAWPLEALDAEPSEPIASPAFTERIQTTMRKAIREAKRHTSWANPLLAYEDATAAFVAAVLGESRDSPFWLEFRRIAEPAARIAMVHGLAQVVLKLTAPGAPDVYQGAELWDFSLVDPDNRRPVDWILRERIAASLPARGEESSAVAAALLGNWRDGRVKMFVTRTLLRLRETRREMFLNDEYAALETVGQYAGHVVALERRGAIAIVPRLVGALGGDVTPPLGATWGDTGVLTSHRRTAQSYRDLFTREIVRTSGEPLRVAEVLSHFPVAVLLPEDEA